MAAHTSRADFPTTAGAFDTSYNGNSDAFVTKLNATGSGLVYSSYLGGSDFDRGFAIAVDGAGSAYVTGHTSSADFPTVRAFDKKLDFADVFVTKLDPSGSSLVYSTFLGGSSSFGGEQGFGIAVDAAGDAFVTGFTHSTDFPTTRGAADSSLDGDRDAFLAKLGPTGSKLLYSTYLGGSDTDVGFGVAADAAGGAYVTGATLSGDFPTTAGAFDTSLDGGFDAFVTKLSPDESIAYSTYLGGGSSDSGVAIAVGGAGEAFVTGVTSSTDFPLTANAVDTKLTAFFCCFEDAFVTGLNSTGSALVYSTYLGGRDDEIGHGIAVDGAGNAYVAGQTRSADFPTTPKAFEKKYKGSGDAFAAKIATSQ